MNGQENKGVLRSIKLIDKSIYIPFFQPDQSVRGKSLIEATYTTAKLF